MMQITTEVINGIKYTVYYNTETKQFVGWTVFSDKTKQGKANVDKYLRTFFMLPEQMGDLLDRLKTIENEAVDNLNELKKTTDALKNHNKTNPEDPMYG